MSEQLGQRLGAALAAEYAAIFAYGRLGVLLDKAGRELARTVQEVHRVRRDALLVQLAALKVDPPAAEAGYAMPFPVTDKASALKLAAYVEDGVAATWRATLSATEGELRKQVLSGYTDAAVRAAHWRRLAGLTPVTVTYPGRPTTR
ncbi:ferritin-like domain-containing protein [Catellatospora tritici]|uniref:ferritin-like domain-containing protein n=1 Tax=Catellatospora tritici TaxID=2851566 RepID=UPI001C2DC2CC|nr:ferritin-like domain-containing protein [Catellatospora tritici]MBV1848592.1 ferritin-like domain-containing protein [Catellatospora tritici]